GERLHAAPDFESCGGSRDSELLHDLGCDGLCVSGWRPYVLLPAFSERKQRTWRDLGVRPGDADLARARLLAERAVHRRLSPYPLLLLRPALSRRLAERQHLRDEPKHLHR